MFLPRHAATEAEEAEPRPVEADAAPPTSPARDRFLLVEDEDAVRAFATRALTARGYNVVAAAGGVEALELMDAAAHRFDLVVSDVVMPEMDGPTLLRQLRARGSGSEGDLHFRLRGGSLRPQSAGHGKLLLPAEAVLPQAIGGGGERGHPRPPPLPGAPDAEPGKLSHGTGIAGRLWPPV